MGPSRVSGPVLRRPERGTAGSSTIDPSRRRPCSGGSPVHPPRDDPGHRVGKPASATLMSLEAGPSTTVVCTGTLVHYSMSKQCEVDDTGPQCPREGSLLTSYLDVAA